MKAEIWSIYYWLLKDGEKILDYNSNYNDLIDIKITTGSTSVWIPIFRERLYYERLRTD